MTKEERVDLQRWRLRRMFESKARKPRNKSKYDRNDHRKDRQRERSQ